MSSDLPVGRQSKEAAIADMRVEVVKRELTQGALAGMGSEVSEYAARLVIAALDSFDAAALAEEFRRGFEAGEVNALLLAEARVRAQVAEEIAQAIERDDMAMYAWEAARIARGLAVAPAESVVAALPDADPESDVAIAEQMLAAGADVFGMVPLSSGCRRGECALCDFGSIHAPCAHDCHVPESALPDVVGTPEHHCPNCEGVDPQTCPYAAEGVINVEE